jgi:hypothetical protein
MNAAAALVLVSLVTSGVSGLMAVPSIEPAYANTVPLGGGHLLGGQDDVDVAANAADGAWDVGASSRSTTPGGRSETGAPTFRETRQPLTYCGSLRGAGDGRACVEGVISGTIKRVCTDGGPALDPLFRQQLDPVTGRPIGDWTQVDAGGCPEDPVAAVTLSAEDFQRLPLTPSGPSYQPADGRGLVNMPLIVFTDASVQQLQTVVLGVPVTVRATPVSFAWDFGDGSDPLVTTDPGAPYPHQTVTHTYLTAGSYSVSLSTTWRGEFQVNGQGPWLPVAGTARTTSTPFVETVEAAPSHLVADPLPAP